jgi:hypothetical protein
MGRNLRERLTGFEERERFVMAEDAAALRSFMESWNKDAGPLIQQALEEVAGKLTGWKAGPCALECSRRGRRFAITFRIKFREQKVVLETVVAGERQHDRQFEVAELTGEAVDNLVAEFIERTLTPII